ncbi:MAG: FAD-dependent oxidoreductase, partial [Pseudomonadota bacterium]
DQASAKLMRSTALEAWRDGRLARPMFAPDGLGEALVSPALSALEAAGAPVTFNRVVKGLVREAGRVAALNFARDGDVALGPNDHVIIAAPPIRLNALYPEARAPEDASSILNAHFVVENPGLVDNAPPIVGLVGGVAQWIFPRGDIVSVTVSAAEAVEGAERPHDEITPLIWDEIKIALELPDDSRYAAARIIREKRATFVQTPENVRRRPKQSTLLKNLYLAGDTVDTGLPATIEGAVRSGFRAAELVARS